MLFTAIEVWIFFIITLANPLASTEADLRFDFFVKGPFASESDCHQAQRYLEIPRGHELLHITVCQRLPHREKL